MKIIIPFKKEVVFKDNISEITSISLEHELSLENSIVKGKFLITGEYLVSSNSNTVLPFNLELPIALAIEDSYDTSKAICDIDDFYYEIVNNQKLSISIDICVDKLLEKELVDINQQIDDLNQDDRNIDDLKVESIELKEEVENKDERNDAGKEVIENNEEDVNEKINSLFSNIGDNEVYVSYNIYIVRDGDTLEDIIEKYNVDIELIKEYNDVSDLKIGDKIIIPSK